MKKLITYDSLRNFAYSNDKICSKPIKGVAISFFGLGFNEMYNEDFDFAKQCAQNGIILIFPYSNPWCWMNKETISFTEEILDVIFNEYNLPNDIKTVAFGASMGGQSALVYTHYAKRTPVSCVVNCPVCDMPFHYTERPDLPRTLYSAFYNEDGNKEEILEKYSPYHLADKMPKNTKYYLFHCLEDKDVDFSKHTEKFVKRLESLKYDVTLETVPGRRHCDLTVEAEERFNNFIINSFK